MGLLDSMRGLLGSPEESSPQADPVQLATAALFVQVMRADWSADPAERVAVDRSLQGILNLSPEAATELLQLAEQEADGAVSLFEFTKTIHQHLSPSQKIEVVEGLWRVVFADGKIDAAENHTMRKIKSLLHIPQKDYIAAKQRARERSPESTVTRNSES